MRLVGLVLTLVLVLGIAFEAQAQASKVAGNPIPKAANGRPDLTGVWQPGTTIAGSWEDANSGTGLGGTGKNPNAPVLLASGDRTAGQAAPPYQAWAADKVREEFNRRGINDPAARCLPLGVPRAFSVSLFPIQIVQAPKHVIVYFEYMALTRIIPIVAKPKPGAALPHRDDQGPTYMGDSVGYWDGDTLVVDVTDFNDKTWLVGTGTLHTDKLHVTERYRRVSKDRIDYTAIMEDPGVLTGPWEWHQPMMLREGTLPAEYVCAENNLDPGRYESLVKAGVKIERK